MRLKELPHDIVSKLLCRAKRRLQNIKLIRQKNIKEVIINQEGTMMGKDGED